VESLEQFPVVEWHMTEKNALSVLQHNATADVFWGGGDFIERELQKLERK
jgi:aromatic ring-cleaving dioxygenase